MRADTIVCSHFQNVLYLFNYFLDPQISCWGFKGALDIWGWYVRHHRLLHRAAANLLWVQTLLSIFGRPTVTADWAPVVQYYGNPFQTGRFRANRVGSWWMLPCNGWVNNITVSHNSLSFFFFLLRNVANVKTECERLGVENVIIRGTLCFFGKKQITLPLA